MARPSWLVDSNRIATKIRSASGSFDPQKIKWNSDPSRACPNCQHTIDNSDVTHEWPGLPRGVKFDPTDQEIIWHLLGKVGVGNLKSHPFIEEFILTVDEDDGICCAHPQNLPGVKQDGSVSHFFHRSIKAYNTGTRKRRKIHGDDAGDVRWHKTGRTKPVILDGVQRGCKKIMVLYMSMERGAKAEKTNWVMHQYHLGVEEDEKDGEYVISKIFYQQQQQLKQTDKSEQDFTEGSNNTMIAKVDPVTPKSVTPEPPRAERQDLEPDLVQQAADPALDLCAREMNYIEDGVQPVSEIPEYQYHLHEEHQDHLHEEHQDHLHEGHQDHLHEELLGQMEENPDGQAVEDHKWWDSESQYLLDSQQLVEGLSLCDDLLQSQSPNRDGNPNISESKSKPRLSDYAHLGAEHLKKDLEACQNFVIDPADIELDTPPDFRLSQLDFGSQESFIAWGGANAG